MMNEVDKCEDSIKIVVANLISKEVEQLARHMTHVKASMDDMYRRMNDLERVVNGNMNIEQEKRTTSPSCLGATS